MKKLVFLMLGLVTIFLFSACQQEASLFDVLDDIQIEYAEGDSASSVSTHIKLPKSSSLRDDAVIEWQSSHPSIVDSYGTVNTPEIDTDVVLTVKVTLGDVSSSNSFTVTVNGRFEKVTVTFKVQDTIYQEFEIKEGSTITPFDNPEIVGYAFEGWFIAPELTVAFDFANPVNDSLTVEAKLRAYVTGEYQVNIYLQNLLDENYTLETTSTYVGEQGTDIELDTDRIGFVLNTELSTATGVISETTTILNLYYTRETYTVIFESDGIEIGRENIIYGELITLPTEPTKEDYVFSHWSTDRFGSTVFIETELISSNTILYAIYESNAVYEGYYASITSVSDGQLKLALRQLITTMTLQTYGDSRYILDDTDEDPTNPNNVILIYNRASVSGAWDGGITWNREHVWPQSMLGASAENGTANIASDLQNLKPANPSINSTRSNYPFVDGTGANRLIGSGYYPGAADRGDIARILLYMHVRWNLTIATSTVGDLDLLLRWHKLDPVDSFELNRNELIYQEQNNRNPFIDHPEFVERIWGPIVIRHEQTSTKLSVDFESIMTEIINIPEINYTELKKNTYSM
jgi:endonuclease I